MLTKTRISDNAILSTFSTPLGAAEHSITVTSLAKGDFLSNCNTVLAQYDSALHDAKISDETAVFTRVYLSDAANQVPIFRQSSLYKRLSAGALSLVSQACMNGGVVCLISYHITNVGCALPRQILADSSNGGNSSLTSMLNYKVLYNAGFSGMGEVDSYAQTQNVLGALGGILNDQKMTLLSNTLRSWIYVCDIDNNYKGMVAARREFFAANNLSEKTHYLASTGIEGKSEQVNSLLTVDLLSIGGLQPLQISRMDALANMPRTIDYGVTFERGLRVRFGDRSHVYISGTASINKEGAVLYPNDICRQTERTIENLCALLATEGGSLCDLAYLLVYIRNFHDYQAVHTVVATRVSNDIPILILHAAVCRPAWLVEMEGVAIIPDTNAFLPFR